MMDVLPAAVPAVQDGPSLKDVSEHDALRVVAVGSKDEGEGVEEKESHEKYEPEDEMTRSRDQKFLSDPSVAANTQAPTATLLSATIEGEPKSGFLKLRDELLSTSEEQLNGDEQQTVITPDAPGSKEANQERFKENSASDDLKVEKLESTNDTPNAPASRTDAGIENEGTTLTDHVTTNVNGCENTNDVQNTSAGNDADVLAESVVEQQNGNLADQESIASLGCQSEPPQPEVTADSSDAKIQPIADSITQQACVIATTDGEHLADQSIVEAPAPKPIIEHREEKEGDGNNLVSLSSEESLVEGDDPKAMPVQLESEEPKQDAATEDNATEASEAKPNDPNAQTQQTHVLKDIKAASQEHDSVLDVRDSGVDEPVSSQENVHSSGSDAPSSSLANSDVTEGLTTETAINTREETEPQTTDTESELKPVSSEHEEIDSLRDEIDLHEAKDEEDFEGTDLKVADSAECGEDQSIDDKAISTPSQETKNLAEDDNVPKETTICDQSVEAIEVSEPDGRERDETVDIPDDSNTVKSHSAEEPEREEVESVPGESETGLANSREEHDGSLSSDSQQVDGSSNVSDEGGLHANNSHPDESVNSHDTAETVPPGVEEIVHSGQVTTEHSESAVEVADEHEIGTYTHNESDVHQGEGRPEGATTDCQLDVVEIVGVERSQVDNDTRIVTGLTEEQPSSEIKVDTPEGAFATVVEEFSGAASQTTDSPQEVDPAPPVAPVESSISPDAATTVGIVGAQEATVAAHEDTIGQTELHAQAQALNNPMATGQEHVEVVNCSPEGSPEGKPTLNEHGPSQELSFTPDEDADAPSSSLSNDDATQRLDADATLEAHEEIETQMNISSEKEELRPVGNEREETNLKEEIKDLSQVKEEEESKEEVNHSDPEIAVSEVIKEDRTQDNTPPAIPVTLLETVESTANEISKENLNKEENLETIGASEPGRGVSVETVDNQAMGAEALDSLSVDEQERQDTKSTGTDNENGVNLTKSRGENDESFSSVDNQISNVTGEVEMGSYEATENPPLEESVGVQVEAVASPPFVEVEVEAIAATGTEHAEIDLEVTDRQAMDFETHNESDADDHLETATAEQQSSTAEEDGEERIPLNDESSLTVLTEEGSASVIEPVTEKELPSEIEPEVLESVSTSPDEEIHEAKLHSPDSPQVDPTPPVAPVESVSSPDESLQPLSESLTDTEKEFGLPISRDNLVSELEIGFVDEVTPTLPPVGDVEIAKSDLSAGPSEEITLPPSASEQLEGARPGGDAEDITTEQAEVVGAQHHEQGVDSTDRLPPVAETPASVKMMDLNVEGSLVTHGDQVVDHVEEETKGNSCEVSPSLDHDSRQELEDKSSADSNLGETQLSVEEENRAVDILPDSTEDKSIMEEENHKDVGAAREDDTFVGGNEIPASLDDHNIFSLEDSSLTVETKDEDNHVDVPLSDTNDGLQEFPEIKTYFQLPSSSTVEPTETFTEPHEKFDSTEATEQELESATQSLHSSPAFRVVAMSDERSEVDELSIVDEEEAMEMFDKHKPTGDLIASTKHSSESDRAAEAIEEIQSNANLEPNASPSVIENASPKPVPPPERDSSEATDGQPDLKDDISVLEVASAELISETAAGTDTSPNSTEAQSPMRDEEAVTTTRDVDAVFECHVSEEEGTQSSPVVDHAENISSGPTNEETGEMIAAVKADSSPIQSHVEGNLGVEIVTDSGLRAREESSVETHDEEVVGTTTKVEMPSSIAVEASQVEFLPSVTSVSADEDTPSSPANELGGSASSMDLATSEEQESAQFVYIHPDNFPVSSELQTDDASVLDDLDLRSETGMTESLVSEGDYAESAAPLPVKERGDGDIASLVGVEDAGDSVDGDSVDTSEAKDTPADSLTIETFAGVSVQQEQSNTENESKVPITDKENGHEGTLPAKVSPLEGQTIRPYEELLAEVNDDQNTSSQAPEDQSEQSALESSVSTDPVAESALRSPSTCSITSSVVGDAVAGLDLEEKESDIDAAVHEQSTIQKLSSNRLSRMASNDTVTDSRPFPEDLEDVPKSPFPSSYNVTRFGNRSAQEFDDEHLDEREGGSSFSVSLSKGLERLDSSERAISDNGSARADDDIYPDESISEVDASSDAPEPSMSPRSDLGILTPNFDTRSEVSVASRKPLPPSSPRLDPEAPLPEASEAPQATTLLIPSPEAAQTVAETPSLADTQDLLTPLLSTTTQFEKSQKIDETNESNVRATVDPKNETDDEVKSMSSVDESILNGMEAFNSGTFSDQQSFKAYDDSSSATNTEMDDRGTVIIDSEDNLADVESFAPASTESFISDGWTENDESERLTTQGSLTDEEEPVNISDTIILPQDNVPFIASGHEVPVARRSRSDEDLTNAQPALPSTTRMLLNVSESDFEPLTDASLTSSRHVDGISELDSILDTSTVASIPVEKDLPEIPSSTSSLAIPSTVDTDDADDTVIIDSLPSSVDTALSLEEQRAGYVSISSRMTMDDLPQYSSQSNLLEMPNPNASFTSNRSMSNNSHNESIEVAEEETVAFLSNGTATPVASIAGFSATPRRKELSSEAVDRLAGLVAFPSLADPQPQDSRQNAFGSTSDQASDFEPIPTPQFARKRLESTASSRFPGSWVGASPTIPQRPSLDVAQGEFSRPHKDSSAPGSVLSTPIEGGEEEEKKGRCVIM